MIGSPLEVEISQGVIMEYNVSAMDILNFKSSDGQEIDLMTLMSDIVGNLSSDDPKDQEKVTNQNLSAIDSTISNLLKIRSEVGAMQNRMESAESKNVDENYNMTDILSQTEDIDFTEKMMEYNIMQTVYMASLQTSAKILPQTLMDYLR